MSEFQCAMGDRAKVGLRKSSSHTLRRRGLWDCPISPTLSIERPSDKDGGMLIKHFSDVDTFLLENGVDCASYVPRYSWLNKTKETNLKLHVEVVEECLKEAACHISKSFNRYDGTCTTTYHVPGQYVLGELGGFQSSINATMAFVDGKLYDTSFIYRHCAATNSFEKVCSLHAPMPLFAKSQCDKPGIAPKYHIDQLHIKSLRTDVQDVERYRSSGLISHKPNALISHGLPVCSDLFIDLGEPKIVTHIGTIGSFISHKSYPENVRPAGYARRWTIRYKEKIEVESDSSTRNWPISYRLYYKASNDTYIYVGNYKANTNEFDLAVNEISLDLGDTPVRFLMLKPISSAHRRPIYARGATKRGCRHSLVRMSVAVYGKVYSPIQAIASGTSTSLQEGPGDDHIIKYSLTMAPQLAGSGTILTTRQVHYHYRDYDCTPNGKLHRFDEINMTTNQFQKQHAVDTNIWDVIRLCDLDYDYCDSDQTDVEEESNDLLVDETILEDSNFPALPHIGSRTLSTETSPEEVDEFQSFRKRSYLAAATSSDMQTLNVSESSRPWMGLRSSYLLNDLVSAVSDSENYSDGWESLGMPSDQTSEGCCDEVDSWVVI